MLSASTRKTKSKNLTNKGLQTEQAEMCCRNRCSIGSFRFKPGASLLLGLFKPVFCRFDEDLLAKGKFKVSHQILCFDLTILSTESRMTHNGNYVPANNWDPDQPLCQCGRWFGC
jgi:hypothetical protein